MDNSKQGNTSDTITRGHPIDTVDGGSKPTQSATEISEAALSRHVVLRWLKYDIPYIAMLCLALSGVVFRLPVVYWLVMIPVFAFLSITAGWRHFETRSERLGLVYRQMLDWLALFLALYILFNSGIQGVLNANARSLAMMTLLALGTFVAGVQARVWQISVVGVVLFLAVPGLGWLDQSPMMLSAAGVFIVALCVLAGWASHRWRAPGTPAGSKTP